METKNLETAIRAFSELRAGAIGAHKTEVAIPKKYEDDGIIHALDIAFAELGRIGDDKLREFEANGVLMSNIVSDGAMDSARTNFSRYKCGTKKSFNIVELKNFIIVCEYAQKVIGRSSRGY